MTTSENELHFFPDSTGPDTTKGPDRIWSLRALLPEGLRTGVLGINGTENRVKVTRVLQIP